MNTLLLISVVAALLMFHAEVANTTLLKHGRDLRKSSGHMKKDHMTSNRTQFNGQANRMKKMQVPSNDVCDIICDIFGDCVEYVCEGGVCCTPGSPYSLCCPYDHPVCDEGGCCTTEYPKECGIYCCEETAFCCPVGCCDPPEYCCGLSCCNAGEICCLDHCCDAGDTCCGSGCCEANQTCCTVGGKLQCCNQTDPVHDCSGQDYEDSCLSFFDSRPCGDKYDPLKPLASSATCPDVASTKVLYRVLRQDENCLEGLKAKSPHSQESVLSFVNCGSKSDFSSQFLSFTSSLDVAKMYAYGVKGAKLAQVEVNDDLLATCNVINLTDRIENKKYLRGANIGLFTANSCGYLLTCSARLPCKEL